MINPLIDLIFIELSAHSKLKINQLATNLKVKQALPELDKDFDLNVFKRNFLLMNGLYQLQNELLNEGQYLHVSSMDIHLCSTTNTTPEHVDPLRDYYLDWQNYQASQEEVRALLTSFWQKYFLNKPKAQPDSLKLNALCEQWQLPLNFDAKQLRKRWHQLALHHHPDKNPQDSEHFKQLQAEYEVLKACLL